MTMSVAVYLMLAGHAHAHEETVGALAYEPSVSATAVHAGAELHCKSVSFCSVVAFDPAFVQIGYLPVGGGGWGVPLGRDKPSITHELDPPPPRL